MAPALRDLGAVHSRGRLNGEVTAHARSEGVGRLMRAVVVGAGIGGLVTAVALARRGVEVAVVFPEAEVGGKMRQHHVGPWAVDAGPTVLTMRWVFEALFADAGHDLADAVPMTPLATLGRHVWPDGKTLDLYTDPDRSEEAIGRFSGPREARAFRRFLKDIEAIHDEVERPFLAGARPTMGTLIRERGLRLPASLVTIDPMRTMWRALGRYFADPKLRQLFGRYATYVGGSPFETAATYNLIFHIEQAGVWAVDGGMQNLARGLGSLAESLGVTFHAETRVEEILSEGNRAVGVRLEGGRVVRADAVCSNAGVSALATGSLGEAVRSAASAVRARSLSAVTFSMNATVSGVPLDYHNVFFSEDYAAEFGQLFKTRVCPEIPTTYLCAKNRVGPVGGGPEPLFCLTNAPANADRRPLTADQIEAVRVRMCAHLERCGLSIHPTDDPTVSAQPSTFEAISPGAGGAIYGGAPHGLLVPFTRPGARSRLKGLYLCGGDCHPGAGVPMVALSGLQASRAMCQDHGIGA